MTPLLIVEGWNVNRDKGWNVRCLENVCIRVNRYLSLKNIYMLVRIFIYTHSERSL